MKCFLWLLAAAVGVPGLLWVWRYQPKPVAAKQRVAVATPTLSPSAGMPVAAGGTPTPTPQASTQPVATETPAPTHTPAPAQTPSPTPTPRYNDGTYTGQTFQAYPYGPVQVSVVISGGNITNVNFLQMPNADAECIMISNSSKPILLQETLTAQSANVNTVSGATQTSGAYKQSLSSALSLA